MKRRLFTLALAALTIGLLGSCSKMNERIDGLDQRVGNIENEKIASIENQIAAINSSIADLGTIRKDITDLQVAVGAKGEDISELKAADEALGQRIDELKAYVGDLSKYAEKDWVTATFATLEQLEATNTALGALEEKVNKLGETTDANIAGLKTELTNAIDSAISGINATISTLEGRVADLEAMIQSVTIVPAYSDGSVEAVDGILTLKCIVSPAEALKGMQSLKDSLLIFADSVKVKTKAATSAYMEIKVSEASVLDDAQGAITLTADISEYLPKGEDKALTVAVNIKNGISNFTTKFVPVTVAAAKPIVEYVEIGGLKWATKNLGATTVAGSIETCAGYHFAWGGTEAYVYSDSQWKSVKDGSVLSGGFSQANAPYYSSAYTKYTSSDSKTVLESDDDAAYKELGGKWRMPTSQEFKDLADACGGSSNYDKDTYKSPETCGESTIFNKGIYWCASYDGVAGCLFCDGTKKLFFPAAGLGDGTDLNNAGSCGYFWSSSLNTGSTDYAYDLDFNSYSVYPPFNLSRHFGFSVRPVSD